MLHASARRDIGLAIVNNNLAVPDDAAWVVDRYSPDGRLGARSDCRSCARGARRSISRRLLRIISNWRWLILGAVALGLVGAIVVTLLTTPLYRSWVTLEVNPPTVEIMDEQSRERSASGVSTWDYVVDPGRPAVEPEHR